MPTEHIARRRGPAAAVLFVACLFAFVAGGCTRDEVGAAIATLAVDMRATLEPWGATTEANIAALAADTTDTPGNAPTALPLSTPATLPTPAPPTSDAPPTAVFTFDTPTATPAALVSTGLRRVGTVSGLKRSDSPSPTTLYSASWRDIDCRDSTSHFATTAASRAFVTIPTCSPDICNK